MEGHSPFGLPEIHLDGLVEEVVGEGVFDLRVVQGHWWRQSALPEHVVDMSAVPQILKRQILCQEAVPLPARKQVKRHFLVFRRCHIQQEVADLVEYPSQLIISPIEDEIYWV